MSGLAQVEAVSALRVQLWRSGFRPVPVFSITADVVSPGKQPLGAKWQIDAQESPPFCARSPAVLHALNTGIASAGLRPLDLDLDDPDKASECRAVANRMFGNAPTRSRQDAPRVLMLCRAAEGEPVKRTLTGRRHSKEHSCKIEVLGKGQQFVAFGQHPDTGAELEWTPAAPGVLHYDELPVVTEVQIQAFLEVCATIINAPVPGYVNGHDNDRIPGEPQADSLRIAAALASIPNGAAADWETWNTIGMAVWGATGGSNAGWEAFNAWSARNDAYRAEITRARWEHYATSPPTHIGAGTIFYLAREATQGTSGPPPGSNTDYDGADRDSHTAPPKDKIPHPETGNPAYPLLDAAAFMATFTNPDYLIDGIVQRGRVHALTSMTGHGKTALALYAACSIAKGWDIGNIEVVQGEVIFLAGENPDDLCGRFFAACQHYNINPADLPIRVMPGNFPMDADTAETLKQQIDATERPPALIIADSAAAYFPGDDENHNVQMGAFARNLRVLTRCKGNPAVLTLCHPVKAAGKENLLPRGGGAFLNEIDVNLTLWADAQETTTLHWQGKIRGADFQPVNFCLKQVKLLEKTDAKGRPFVSIVAALQTTEQAEKAVTQATTDENTVLEWLRRAPGISMSDIARNASWHTEKGDPQGQGPAAVEVSRPRQAGQKLAAQMANY